MPYRRKTKFRKFKRTAGKRGVKRRKSGGGRMTKRRRTSGKYSGGRKYGGGAYGVLSKRRWVKLKYINASPFDPTFALNGALRTSGADNIYRCNDCYDPQYASAASSTFNMRCAGFGFWAKLYSKYEVMKAHIKMTIRQVSPSTMVNPEPLVIGLRQDDDASLSGYTGYEQFVGDPNTKWKTMTFTTDPGNAKPVVLKMTWKKKLDAANPAANWADTNGALASGIEYFVPFYQTASHTAYLAPTGVPRLSYQVSITYWAKFAEPKDLGATSDIVMH